MKIHIDHKTHEYRGDHDAEISLAVNVKEGETIEQLSRRVLNHSTDWLEIRVEKEYEQEKNDETD